VTTDSAPHRALRPWMLIALLVATIALFTVLVAIHSAGYRTPVTIALPLGALLCGAPLLAIDRPRAALVVFGLAAIALPLFAGAEREPSWPWPWSVPAMIAFVLFLLVTTTRHGWRLGLASWAVGTAGPLVLSAVLPKTAVTGTAGVDLLVTTSLTGSALIVGSLLAGRIRVGEELTRERAHSAAEQERRLLVEERTRIARELHDVIAHTTSLIQVQASTARYRIPELPEAATSEFEEIAETARGSLLEMRRLLGVLRTEDHVPELTPQQGIADIPELVEGARRAGAEVSLHFDAPSPEPSPSLQVAAFRITQEALSNAVRHAPGAALEVEIAPTEDVLVLRVHNGSATRDATAGGAAAAITGSGHGLRGMQERVTLLGGSLLAGPEADGGWTVTAMLPLTAQEGSS